MQWLLLAFEELLFAFGVGRNAAMLQPEKGRGYARFCVCFCDAYS